MLKVENLSYIYKDNKFSTINNLTFSASKGEIILLKGQNGSGKSTVLNILGKLIKPQKGTKIILTENETIGMVFQDPSVQVLFDTVYEDIEFVLENHNIDKSQYNNKIENALKKVGLQNREKENPKHFSMGQKQRVAIASMLALNPKILLLDEPTAMLDPEGKIEIRKILKDLAKKEMIIVYASNDPYDFDIATKIVQL